MRRSFGEEWPTWLLCLAIYGGFITLILLHDAIPWFLAVPLGGLLLAWHASLQHEIIHGHPTGLRRVDTALGGIPLSVWLPYVVYRSLHLRHHRDPHLTCPIEDPESFYVTAETWNRLSPFARGVLIAHRTLLGRLLLGPALAIGGLWSTAVKRIVAGDRHHLRVWVIHLGLVAALLGLVIGVAGVPVWLYAAWIYIGVALLLLRSFAEHKALPGQDQRTAVVDRAPLFGLLFLNNNLHVAHHARPGVAWWRLPRLARSIDARQTASHGAGLYHGYADVAARFLLRPLDHPVHPAHAGQAVPTGGEVGNALVVPSGGPAGRGIA